MDKKITLKALLGDNVAIEQDKPEETTASGLYIKEKIQSYLPIGTVKMVGPEVKHVHVGDRVVYEYHGSKGLNEDLDIVQEEAVQALING